MMRTSCRKSHWFLGLCLTVSWVSFCLGQQECVSEVEGGPFMITADCTDPLYRHAVIDSRKDEPLPVPHRRVHGYWNDTQVDFNIYLPPKNQFAGRFFQGVYPTQNSTALPDAIAFAAASGAYAVCNAGQLGYRAEAATAKFARTVAADYYQIAPELIYGYVYGGSGGSYQTVGAAENTHGVWNGAIVMVQAVPGSVPLNLCARALGNLVLRPQAMAIEKTLQPGGTGDPWTVLNSVQGAVLRELTDFGVPLQAWENFFAPADSTIALSVLTPTVQQMDPSYADDFWSKQGYLGTEDSGLGRIFQQALVDHIATVAGVVHGLDDTTEIILDWAPEINQAGYEFTAYATDSTTALGSIAGQLSISNKTLTLDVNNNINITAALAVGTKIRIDNRWNLALHAYHRHQLPSRDGFSGYNQYRTESGEPLYPQRDLKVGELLAQATSGGATHAGSLTMKMIVIDNLMDSDSFPLHADWYKSVVQTAMGDSFDDTYRLWYNERSDHYSEPLNQTRLIRLVPYNGIYEQALRDMSAWVENGSPAPQSTRYTVQGGQIVPAKLAQDRGGVQPTVDLNVSMTEGAAPRSVFFSGVAEVPPGVGKVVGVEWDYLGTGDFVNATLCKTSERVAFSSRFEYATEGTYLPSVRVLAQRDEAPGTPFARIYNMARVAVTIK